MTAPELTAYIAVAESKLKERQETAKHTLRIAAEPDGSGSLAEDA